jgi:hypothetical protein
MFSLTNVPRQRMAPSGGCEGLLATHRRRSDAMRERQLRQQYQSVAFCRSRARTRIRWRAAHEPLDVIRQLSQRREPLKAAFVVRRSLVAALLWCYSGHLKLIEPAILHFLLGYILADGFGIASNRINEETSGPNPLPSVISLSLQKVPRHVNRTLALDVPYHARYCQFWRHIDQHVYVIRHDVPLFYPTFFLLCQSMKHFPEMFPHYSV